MTELKIRGGNFSFTRFIFSYLAFIYCLHNIILGMDQMVINTQMEADCPFKVVLQRQRLTAQG